VDEDLVDLSGPLSGSLASHIERTIRDVSGRTGMVSSYICLVKWVADDGKIMWSLARMPGQETETDLALVDVSKMMVKERLRAEWGIE
jgi:hypothetical protein